ncbi:MAG: hypothetical protein ACRD2B_14940 [Terriglobia bacterium]
MSFVYVFTATRQEAKPVAKLMAQGRTRSEFGHRGVIGSDEVELIVSGTGPLAAHACARKAVEQSGALRADAILVAGFCGALSSRFPESTLVVYLGCLSTLEDRKRLSSPLAPRLCTRLITGGIPCVGAVGITSARIASSKAEKLALAASGAEVVDMESYPILQLAAAAAIPCLVLRVVSDSLDRRLPDFNPALQPNGRMSLAAAARVALRSPLRTVQLVRASRKAMEKLSIALPVIFAGGGFQS